MRSLPSLAVRVVAAGAVAAAAAPESVRRPSVVPFGGVALAILAALAGWRLWRAG